MKIEQVWEARLFERVMPGGRTRPLLVNCSLTEGNTTRRCSAVIKGLGHPATTAQTLGFEALGYLMAPAFECNTPNGLLVNVSDEFIAANAELFVGLGFTPEAGLAFGSELVENFNPIIPRSKPKQDHLVAAAHAYAFDMAIQNVDRRSEKPNCGLDGQNGLVLFDFENAFSFCVPLVLAAAQPWEVTKYGFATNHVFYSWLKGQPIDWEWVTTAAADVAAQTQGWADSLPAAWNAGMDQIVQHFNVVAARAVDFGAELEASLK